VIASYNAGEGTMISAIDNAKQAGEKDPYTAALDEKYLKPAILSNNVEQYYTHSNRNPYVHKGHNPDEKAINFAVDKKYNETREYVKKVFELMKKIIDSHGIRE
jgi:hypothetical protein